MDVALVSQNISIGFGTDSTGIAEHAMGWKLDVAIPVLGPIIRETVFVDGDSRRIDGEIHLAEGKGVVAGCLVRRGIPGSLEVSVQEAYRELFRILGKRRSLYRVWNYVPRINAVTNGLENYWRFNIGRSRAFAEHYGADFIGRIPAASALGIDDDCFALAFVAGDRAPRYVENADQIPAYRYPAHYGPKAPTFARGTVVDIAGQRTGFLSGTSSVKGHRTLAAGDFEEQFRVTLDNIRIVTGAMGFGGALESTSGCEADFRFFVRNAADGEKAKRLFEQLRGARVRQVIYLRSDICRADLSLEIEAVFREPFA